MKNVYKLLMLFLSLIVCSCTSDALLVHDKSSYIIAVLLFVLIVVAIIIAVRLGKLLNVIIRHNNDLNRDIKDVNTATHSENQKRPAVSGKTLNDRFK